MTDPRFQLNRRRILQAGAAAAAAAFIPSLEALAARRAAASAQLLPAASPYGPLRPAPDLATGLHLLQLPEGFSYRSFSWTGDMMNDGQTTPDRHDGMAVIAEQDGKLGTELVLVRNHENGFGPLIQAPSQYDTAEFGSSERRRQLGGGTTNLRFRPESGEWVSAIASLGGTMINCAGGPTPWATWLSCEETIEDLSDQGGRKHGYVFEVSTDPAATPAEPIVGMGRFRHEAVAVDPATGMAYLTEDHRNLSGLYRYIPDDASPEPGALARGGRLQAAKVKGVRNADLMVPRQGDEVELEWVDIDDPDAAPAPFSGRHAGGDASGPFMQAWRAGALRLSRGEGIWYHAGKLYIVDTSAGASALGRVGYGEGAIWMLDLGTMRMRALFVSGNALAGDNPDNITVSPRGGVLACEDGDAVTDEFGKGSRLLGLTARGESYIFAKNNARLTPADLTTLGKTVEPGDYRDSEFCGACFDSQGRVLFVNMQRPGITLAIWGPWQRGNL